MTNTTSTASQTHVVVGGKEVIEFRCDKCDKLLAKNNDCGIIAGQIKCSRCKTINSI